MENNNSSSSWWIKCENILLKVTPIITGIATVAAPLIDCLTHSAKNKSNVQAQQQISDIRYNDWVRRQEYRQQHPYRSYRRKRHGTK